MMTVRTGSKNQTQRIDAGKGRNGDRGIKGQKSESSRKTLDCGFWIADFRKTPIELAPQKLLRARPFPPLTLGLLHLRGRAPLEQGSRKPELRMCQPLLFYLGRVFCSRRQSLVTYAASAISQPSSPIHAELSA